MRHVGSFVGARALSCPEACGILVPRPRIEPASPALEGGFLPTGPPGKFQYHCLLSLTLAMLIGQLFSCSFSLGLSISPFNRHSSTCLVEATFWPEFQWTEVLSGLRFLIFSSPCCKQRARDMEETVCLVGGWVDGWVNQHLQVEPIRRRWRQRPVGGWEEVWVVAAAALPQAPVHRDCPSPLPFRSYL